jgi:pyruvate/2-oxoglutarate/acetoin dehydrogenase E1 component
MTKIPMSEIINKTISRAMYDSKKVICFGLGVTDPKGVFGTTLNLEKKHGSQRVFDVPASENALTGFAIGASLNSSIPILTHQRLDFALLSLDQIINGAAKWLYMFGGELNVPITIRMIIGRGWGQGPTHSQNLQSVFSHIPGLKVVSASTPDNVANLLYSSIFDPNPVIFLEHRWLHNSMGTFPKKIKTNELGKCKVLKKGKDITLISLSYMTLECIEAAKILNKFKIDAEIVDLRTISPLDQTTIINSLKKTRRALVADTSNSFCGISSTIASIIYQNINNLKDKIEIISLPFCPEPTSHQLVKHFYNDRYTIVNKVLKMFKINKIIKKDVSVKPDVPGDWFQGPF